MALQAWCHIGLLRHIALTGLLLLAPLAPMSAAPVALPDFVSLVENVADSVVHVGVHRGQRDHPLRHLLPRGGPDSATTGSGFVLDSDGLIVTNMHVVEDAEEIVVRLRDRREYRARVIGSDKLSDIALLKIPATGLKQVRLADAATLRPGAWVVAIGSPFHLEYSVTAGIISALGRSMPYAQGQYVPYLQTDVAINPGSSGGPLFNLSGEVVGVSSQIFSSSGSFMGVAFAIPVDLLRDVTGQLREHGEVERGWLGIALQEVTSDLALALDLPKPTGALVSKVEPDSPADRAGLKAGDVILAVDDQPVAVSGDLPHLIGSRRPGTRVGLSLVRASRKQALQVRLGDLSQRSAEAGPKNPVDRVGKSFRSDSQERFGVHVEQNPNGESGVRVKEVRPGSNAARAGIRPQDVILSVNGIVVYNAGSFYRAVKQKSALAKPLLLHIMRGNSVVFVSVRVDGKKG